MQFTSESPTFFILQMEHMTGEVSDMFFGVTKFDGLLPDLRFQILLNYPNSFSLSTTYFSEDHKES